MSDLEDGEVITVAGTDLQVMHTPGHAPGAVCLYAPDLGCVFTGDTLFHGGPGATGRSFSDYPTIVESIRNLALATCVTLLVPPEGRPKANGLVGMVMGTANWGMVQQGGLRWQVLAIWAVYLLLRLAYFAWQWRSIRAQPLPQGVAA